MKKIFFMGVMGMFLLGSCNNHSGHSNEGHDHEEQAHNHEGHSHEQDHEGHNHEAGEHNHEGHNHEATDAHDHEGHNHEAETHNHEGHNHAQEAKADAHAGHDHGHEHGSNPDEIILAPEKAKAAGVASMEIQPKAFRQVIKASGEVQSAQGNESTIVANVSGVVSFQRSVTEGMQVGKGTALMSISASN